MKKVKYLIALAGLFHDMGKFYQRATNIKTSDEEKREFGYAHAVLSAKVIKKELYEGLNTVFSKEEIDQIIQGSYHHKPRSEIEFLIQKADWVSSSERAREENIFNLELLPEGKRKDLEDFAKSNPRLRSIFENIRLDKKTEPKNYFYKISPLNLSNNIFPYSLEKAYTDIEFQGKKDEDLLGSYSKHWKEFQKEFNQKLKHSALRFNDQPEKVFSLIYHLFYKYLWCIPASTYDRENYSNHYPDISLFDHSRVLSAVACCFIDFNRNGFTQKSIEEFKKEFKNKKVFLHIKADISGIQKFIYNVYQGKGGVAKILRGRSFYVALLPEVLSRYILNELEYPISNLLYSGGGIFEILVANTEQNKNKLEKIKKQINQFLATEFEADLGLSIGIYEYSPVEMMEDYESVLRNLNENLDNAKKEKFEKLIDSGEIFELLNEKSNQIKGNKKKCPVCQTYLINENLTEEKEICDACNMFKNIGQNLPRTETLVFAKSKTKNFIDDNKVIEFKNFGIVYLFTKTDKEKKEKDLKQIFYDKETLEVLDINNTNFGVYTTGFKFMGKIVPEAIKPIPPEESGENETIEKNQIAPFTYLAKYSDGDKRIGIVRMDVDNLGRLFSEGLSNKISISRIATLSRSLDLFFAGYLNTICDSLSNNYKNNYPDPKINNLFYILYSGGDDVFLVAPWDKAIDIARKIQENFTEYTCNNPNITISAGYLQTKPKFPIRVSADLAGESEDIAKESGKNRICVLGDVLEWNQLEEARKIAEEWVENIKSKDNKLQRGFIYAVHRLKEQFLKDDKNKNKLVFLYKKEENLMFYPYAHYYISRNIKDFSLKEKIANFLLKRENFNKLTFVVNYASLKTRE